MRLVQYLFVLIVVLSTSAWAAPTQAELPGSWTRAALLTHPAAVERDLRVVVECASVVEAAAVHACDRLTGRSDCKGCGQALVRQPWKVSETDGPDHAYTSAEMAGAWSTRGQVKVAFSNETERDNRLRASAGI
ncbi:hypothetical protein NYR97_07745 [Xanthomonas hydrangeae]|uniref:DUF2147 domain-containing protein n=1 Tax=Xanthomonas hydrangeae TaxID=2775159 RepID=A0AAU0BDZ5_9XANT|nr:hypothetical protein [Xanthomonas hydrangeae]WOB51255.1 hypothetical protein NYR97_07745 [Xanthomonas hydrangeae]